MRKEVRLDESCKAFTDKKIKAFLLNFLNFPGNCLSAKVAKHITNQFRSLNLSAQKDQKADFLQSSTQIARAYLIVCSRPLLLPCSYNVLNAFTFYE